MNKELKVLYTIFELEMAPPLIVGDDIHPFGPTPNSVLNRFSNTIGKFDDKYNIFQMSPKTHSMVFERIRQTFSLGKISDKHVYNIAKHLFIWIQDKFPDQQIDFVLIDNSDTGHKIRYPGNSITKF